MANAPATEAPVVDPLEVAARQALLAPRPETQSLIAQMRAGFMAAGADAVTATSRTYAAMAGLVARQAAMVSFVTLFELLGFIFLALLPLVLLMKRPRAAAGPGVGAH